MLRVKITTAVAVCLSARMAIDVPAHADVLTSKGFRATNRGLNCFASERLKPRERLTTPGALEFHNALNRPAHPVYWTRIPACVGW